MERSIKIIFLCACFLILFTVSASAQYYSDEYPAYLPYNGVIYIEVNSSLGQGTIVVPVECQNNTFCLGYTGDIYNITGSTVTGVFVKHSGSGSSANRIRFASFSNGEYYQQTGMTSTWNSFTVSEILNTNVVFVDYSGSDTQNDNFYLTNYEKIIFAFVVLDLLFDFISIFRKVRGSFSA